MASMVGVFVAGINTASGLGGIPIPYDLYTVTNGAISPTGCPTPGGSVVVTCTDDVSDQGMLQRRITVSGASPDANGTYIQFIITDPKASGDASKPAFDALRGSLNFTNEDFVKMHNRGKGIASQNVIIDAKVNGNIEDRFVNVSTYAFGSWATANPTLTPWIDIQQDITRVDTNTMEETFVSSAHIVDDAQTGNIADGTNRKVELSQTVDLSTPSNGAGVQGFKYVKASGVYQTTGGSGTVLPGGTNGGSVGSWVGGDELTALWIGQSLNTGGGGTAKFGHTQYTATTAGLFGPISNTTKLTSFLDPNPVNWGTGTPPFLPASVIGPAPSLPSVPITATGTFTPTPGGPLMPTVAAGSAPGGTTTPPTLPNYDDWTVSGGVFTVSCTVGSCGSPIVNERGLFQRVVSIGGVEYIQTIITDTTATGDPKTADFQGSGPTAYLAFKNETFTRRITGGGSGIASNLHIAEQDTAYQTTPDTNPLPSTGGQFAYNTRLKTGWANGGGTDPRVTVDQRVLVADSIGVNNPSSMDNIFHLEQGVAPIDQRMAMATTVGVRGGGGGFTEPVMFASSKVSGAFQGTTSTASAPNPNVSWNQYDGIQVTWVGMQTSAPPDPFGPSRIATTSYTNLTTGARASATRTNIDAGIANTNTAKPDPTSWVAPFTVAPPFAPATAPSYPAGPGLGVYVPPAWLASPTSPTGP